MKPALLLVCLALFFCGCTSYQQLKPGRIGGGYNAINVGPGLILLEGQTGAKPRPDYKTAWATFYRRADELFGVNGYDVILLNEFTFSPFDAPLPGMPQPLVSFAHGFVLSKKSPLSKAEALRQAHDYIGIKASLAGMKESDEFRPTR